MSSIYLVNPRKRRKAPKRRKARARRASTAVATAPKRRRRKASRAVTVRRYKRNPRFGGGLVKNVTQALVPSAIAAGGALAADVALGFAFDKITAIPERFKTGILRHVARGAAAVGVGTLAGLMLKPDVARQVMAGGLTVAMHGALRDVMGRVAPQVPLADLDDDIGRLEQDLGTLLTDERASAGVPAAASAMGALEPESRFV